jgi:nucleoside-diphosphate-sugar epimerase
LYGPDDNPDWVIPYVITTVAKGLRPALTAGEQLWDYLYVEDAAEAILAVLTRPTAEGIFNIGSGQCYHLRTLIEELRNSINPSVDLGFGEIPYRSDQVMHLLADISKLTKATGWYPRTSISEGLKRTVSWYTKAT